LVEGAREFTARWFGRIRAGAEDEHAQFVAWLSSAEGVDLLRRANLTEYALYQQGDDLLVVYRADRPSITAGFLRNRRLWPSGWEFVRPGTEQDLAGIEPVVRWNRS
jgi:hypothetical protein